MKLACVAPHNDGQLGEIVERALRRSFTADQVVRFEPGKLAPALGGVQALVLCNPEDALAPAVAAWLTAGGAKLAVFGAVGPRLARILGIAAEPLGEALAQHAGCAPAAVGGHAESALALRYSGQGLGAASPVAERPLCRYDFAAEWNNLGYGPVRADGSIWALAHRARAAGAQVVASVVHGAESVSAFATVRDTETWSALWINRAVGMVDSAEWRLVEHFFVHYRPQQLACLSMVSEIPFGWDAAVTMRLDCDEDAASAAALLRRYREERVPLSLAITTRLLAEPRHCDFAREVAAGGGSLLSHSVTHPVNWGGSYEHALREARESREALLPLAADVRYAVSPFHQNPLYAVRAMADAGYDGFVGGIVANDPEYLIGRSGEVPGGGAGFVSHSQQCMLHGDCMLAEGDPLRLYTESFAIARRARSLFGYLDHPFSDRYQYGWHSEEQRLRMHGELIGRIRSGGRVLFLSENDALDFLRARGAARFRSRERGFALEVPAARAGAFAVEHRGTVVEAGGAGT